MKKIAMKFLLIVVLSTFLGLHARADDDDPTDPGGDPDDIPLDPGSWVLVAAGVGYGVKKWNDARHQTNKNGIDEPTTVFMQETKQNKTDL